MDIPTRITPRLILQPFVEGDVDTLHRILGGKDVLCYFPTTDAPSRERVAKLIAAQLKHWEKHGYGWWAVTLRSGPGLIGWCGLQYLPETGEVEVAYLLDKDHWGRGLATEAARASLRFGFEGLGLESIVAIVHWQNTASQRVVEKLEMPFVERRPYFGLDCFRYEMHRSQWTGRARGAVRRRAEA
jgi:ribosomal-protein-alanine N-acetyltransferase